MKSVMKLNAVKFFMLLTYSLLLTRRGREVNRSIVGYPKVLTENALSSIAEIAQSRI